MSNAAFVVGLLLVTLLTVPAAPAGAAGDGAGPGAPGERSTWTPADKQGFGTARSTASKVWFTLGGELTEVYYPRLDTPSVRDLELVVSDGRTFAEREHTATTQQVRLLDPRGLRYQQVNTARSGRYRITKTYTTDPARSALLLDVTFQSLDHAAYQVYALFDPALANSGDDDTGSSRGTALLASDPHGVASALLARPAFSAVSSGFLGTSDGWTDLERDFRMDFRYRLAEGGNVVQTGRTHLTGLPGGQRLTLALGLGTTQREALTTAGESLRGGFGRAAGEYAAGWHAYLDTLAPVPASTQRWRSLYELSALVLAAHEDKTFRGGFVASPSMPWAWGTDLGLMGFGAYHNVWSRDQYEIATTLLALGDRAAANRALSWLFEVQQRADGSFPQNSRLDAAPSASWTPWPAPPTPACCCPSRSGTAGRRPARGRASPSARRPSRPRRWPGRTRSSCAWRSPSRPVTRSSSPPSSPAATCTSAPGSPTEGSARQP